MTAAALVLAPVAGRPRILVVDDHCVLLDALSFVLAPVYDTRTVDCLQKLDAALDTFLPDVVIFDNSMPEGNAIGTIQRLLRKRPELKLILLSMQSDATLARRASDVGAHAFLPKRASSDELLRVIGTVLSGGHYFQPHNQHSAQPSTVPSVLTDRQRQVLRLIALGLSAKEIANHLDISVRTAEFHRATIMERLGLRSTALMTRYAMERGLV